MLSQQISLSVMYVRPKKWQPRKTAIMYVRPKNSKKATTAKTSLSIMYVRPVHWGSRLHFCLPDCNSSANLFGPQSRPTYTPKLSWITNTVS